MKGWEANVVACTLQSLGLSRRAIWDQFRWIRLANIGYECVEGVNDRFWEALHLVNVKDQEDKYQSLPVDPEVCKTTNGRCGFSCSLASNEYRGAASPSSQYWRFPNRKTFTALSAARAEMTGVKVGKFSATSRTSQCVCSSSFSCAGTEFRGEARNAYKISGYIDSGPGVSSDLAVGLCGGKCHNCWSNVCWPVICNGLEVSPHTELICEPMGALIHCVGELFVSDLSEIRVGVERLQVGAIQPVWLEPCALIDQSRK